MLEKETLNDKIEVVNNGIYLMRLARGQSSHRR